MQDVARFYGLQISRNGMACCPFHDDKTPSLKIYPDHYYCFGCRATGDAVGFVAKLYEIKQIDAAKKISHDFGLRLFEKEIADPVQIKPDPDREFRMWLIKAEQAVNAYLNKLYQWRTRYMPKRAGEQESPLFVESLIQTDYTEYLHEILTCGSDWEKRDLFEKCRSSIDQIQKRLAEIAARERTAKRKIL